MDKFETVENFEELGFVILRNVLSTKEVKALRSFIQERHALHGSKRAILPHEVYQYQELYLIPFQEKIIKTLKQVLGESLCYFPDLSIQCDMYGYPGWHTDCGYEIPGKYLLEKDYKLAKCGIYLQDNSYEWGGGIYVIPKGHKFPILTGNPKVDFFFKKLIDRISRTYSIPRKPIILDSKAGDMLIFDSRLPHAPVPPADMSQLTQLPTSVVKGIPVENMKLVVYWDASNIKMKNDFLVNAEKRAKSEDISAKLFYSGWLKNYFPDDFPDDFRVKAQECDIDIACLDKQKCQTYSLLLKKCISD